MIAKKYLIKNPFFLKPIPPNLFTIKIKTFSSNHSFSNLNAPDNPKKVNFFRNKLNKTNFKRIYEMSKKMNILRFWKKEMDEQKLIKFLGKVQAMTCFSIYEAASLTYIFNYFDFLDYNHFIFAGGGVLLALASFFALQKIKNPNKFIKFSLYQSLIISLSMIFAPIIITIPNPIMIQTLYIISASSCLTSQIVNHYLIKKKWLLPFGIFVGGVINSYVVLHGISIFSFVAVGNNPFVAASKNFWVKNEIYIINAIFAFNTNSAVKRFKIGETEYIEIALSFYLRFVQRMMNLMVFLIGKIRK